MSEEKGFTTRAVHAWQDAEPLQQEPAAVPIYQTAPFVFRDMEQFAAVGKSQISGGYLYTRWANPTVDAFTSTVASLEGAEAGAGYASGMGAIHATLASLVRSGDRILSAKQIYGGTYGLFADVLPRGGIEIDLVDITDLDAVEASFRDGTRVLYFEVIGNPTLPLADVDALVALAHARDVTVVVDATFTPPYLYRPIEHSVDLVVHSATKYIGGHSDVTAGVVSGSAEAIARVRHIGLELGGSLAPFEAWLGLRGVQTLALRMDRICANALAVASALEKHRGVERTTYPGLKSHSQHDLAARQLAHGFGGMVTAEVAGGTEAGRRLMERVHLFSPAASLGGTKSLIVHPASVTHSQLSREQREAAGITDGLVRLSIGIEDPEDLIDDLDRALS